MTSAEQIHGDDAYWFDARNPLPCLLFLVPLLFVYEGGVLLLANGDPNLIRNGADYWMRGWLQRIGLGHALLPLLVIMLLLAWHLLGKYPWRVQTETLVGMLAESMLFALVLVVFGQVHDLVFASLGHTEDVLVNLGPASRVITFIGAGVYEEVMFRLFLLPIGFAAFRLFEFPKLWAAVMAATTTSVIFAFAHYIGPAADTFCFFTFSFRALAGSFFAALFFVRGFGITVGTHAAYDLIVGVLLANAA